MFLNQSLKINSIAKATLMGETDPPSQSSRIVTSMMDGHNDNNYIKAHKLGNKEWMLSDTTVAVGFSRDWTHWNETLRPSIADFGLPNARSWKDHDVSVNGHVCFSGVMAHGFTDPSTGVYTGLMGCQGTLMRDYHVIYTINPDEPDRRIPLARIELPRGRAASIMHSMGHTPNYIIVTAHPLHLSISAMMAGKTMTTGGLVIGKGPTIFQVVSRLDGSVRTFDAPSFFSGHVVNAYEEEGDLVVDMTWYQADEHLMFYGIDLFKVINSKEIRDAYPNAVLKRYRLKASGAVEGPSLLLPDEKNDTAFELPKVNERVYGYKYCIFYAMQPHSYDYSDPTSRVAGPFGSVAIAKRNICTGEVQGSYAPNEYPAEAEFIPNPAGTGEDDGVLLGIVFDGLRNTSFLQIVDARNMKRIASADLPTRVPFPVHASFFPDPHTETVAV